MNQDMVLDIIREIINIGVGDAAAALSDMVQSRVTIRTPDIHILESSKAPAFIQQEIKDLGVYIAQDFKGRIHGKTLLFYTRESCASLLKALLGDVMATRTLTDTAIATLQEIGNIIMVSCMSTISNMIEDDITFDIPDVTVEISEGYFQNLVREIKTLDHTIIVRNEMSIDATHVQGYIFVLLGFQDFVAVARDLAKKMQVNIGAGDEQNHE